MTILLDIETRSRADLPEVGAYRYGCDPSTEVMLMGVTTEEESQPVRLWVNPKFESAGIKSDPEAIELLKSGTKFVAHNAPFEIAVLDNKTDLFPWIPLNQWHCTQAMARIAGVAESLEKCAAMLQLGVEKDAKGKALIRRFSIPKDDGTFNEPSDFPDEWRQFCEYCRQDVVVERKIWHKLKGFRIEGVNWDTWQLTLRMNEAGIPVNTTALRNAQAILDEVTRESGVEFTRLTGLQITQREKVRQWLGANGVALEDMQAETLQSLDKSKLPAPADRVIELYSQMSFAAAKKVSTMLQWVMPDDRMRGVFKFHGTGTGRWSAGGPQIQNAKKATPAMRPVTKEAYAAICRGASAKEIDAVYGNPVEVISSCIRHFVHKPDARMLDADYNAIEARIACWLADDTEALDEYRKGVDRYRRMAALIFNVNEWNVSPDQRDLGKQAILGLSYGMGAEKFRTSCQLKGINISNELAERAKDTFRSKHWRMVELWSKLDNALRTVVDRFRGAISLGPTSRISVSSNFVSGNGVQYVQVELPSGRKLNYRSPMLQAEPGFPGRHQFTYYGQIPMSQQWGQIKLYGAKLFENICQAVAADLMSYGAQKAEERWMAPFALIHDQALAIQLEGQTADQFAAALQELPPWAAGLPLKAEAKSVNYYSK